MDTKTSKAQAQGRKWAKGMTLAQADRLDTDRAEGVYDWRDWFDTRPEPGFWGGVYETWRAEHPGRF